MFNKRTALAVFLCVAAAASLTACNTAYDYDKGTGVNHGATNNSTDIGAVNGTGNAPHTDDGLSKGTGVGAGVNNAVDDFVGTVEGNAMGTTNYR